MFKNKQLQTAKEKVEGMRKPLFKNSLANKMWVMVDSGKEMSVKQMATYHNITSSRVYTLMGNLWKRGYFVAPIPQEKGPSIIRNVMAKEEWFQLAMSRYVSNYYAPITERIFAGLEGALGELPSAAENRAEIEREMRRILTVSSRKRRSA